MGFALSFAAGQSTANVISSFETVFNSTMVTAGVGGMRDTGTGTLTVSGVTGPVDQSLLYWAGPTNSTDPAANAHVQVNETPVVGTNIGFSQDNFWSTLNSQAYRADTTSVINGNGAYNLSNFVNSDAAGNVANVNGAGSLLFFNGGNNMDHVIFDGNDANFASSYDPAGWNLNLNGINYSGGNASITFMVSDGQNFGTTDDGTIRINGVDLVSGGIFQGDTLCCGTGPTDNGNLWDIETFDITDFLTAGINNLNITLDAGISDAIADIVAVVNLPAGAAPLTPSVPEPSTLALFGISLTSLIALRRKAH
jgi:hypothetical protein